jgi:signal transduction histidine kinase
MERLDERDQDAAGLRIAERVAPAWTCRPSCAGRRRSTSGRRLPTPARVRERRARGVLSNLLVNAIRHGQGAVTLRGFGEGDRYVFHISDDGGGVADEYAEQMFLPFSRRSDRSDSTGLGLAIARAIVEAHGGSLVYLPASETVPHQFVVALPRDGSGGTGWSSTG